MPDFGFDADSIRRGASWLTGSGPDSDVVVSSRVRLARNIAGFPFLSRASEEDRMELLALARRRVTDANLSPHMAWLDIHRAKPLDRTLMVERHLISKQHAKGTRPRAVAVSKPDERLSIMVNEEDHLRVQVLRSGMQLADAFEQINAVDDRLEGAGTLNGLEYSYSTTFGYLTACPTNVGTGIRISVMLHLPGLKLTGEMDKVRRATHDMALAVRGYYGEGSDAVGDFYQISNQTTLGKPESLLLHEFEHEILPKVITYERASRHMLLKRRTRVLEDQVYRALGTLQNARLLKPEEALALLSLVRLGIATGLVTDVDEATVNQLILLSQPAHLQMVTRREMNQNERREARADLVRSALRG